jgi:hypothetical protein
MSAVVTDALMMAIWRRGKPDALLHHSDRGSQSGLKWSSQHPDEGGCDEDSKAAFGSVWAGGHCRRQVDPPWQDEMSGDGSGRQ